VNGATRHGCLIGDVKIYKPGNCPKIYTQKAMPYALGVKFAEIDGNTVIIVKMKFCMCTLPVYSVNI